MIGPFLRAPNVSQAWLDAIRHVRVNGDCFQLIVRIENMTLEDATLRLRVDAFLEEAGLPSVATVRNTIFPKTDARFARGNVAKLVERYRATYQQTRRYDGNRGGTYFGRIVAAKPFADGETYDQLSLTIEKLRQVGTNATRMEIDMSDVEDPDDSVAVGIYEAERDVRKKMGFPCLSHVAFQRDGDALQTIAFYRNQDMVRKAYGNYLGLAQLSAYIAEHANLQPGTLTVVAGRAYIAGQKRLLDARILHGGE